jgi:hypothetical protein
MIGRLCIKCASEPAMRRRRICQGCLNAQMAVYMRQWRRRQPTFRCRASWAGIPDAKAVQRHVYDEAKARGVPVETVIREWGLRPG